MKTIILILLLAATMFAAPPTPTIPPGNPNDVCVTIAPADQARVTEAFGSILNLKDDNGNPRPATVEEIQAATAQWMGGQVHDYERRKNMSTFTPPPFSSGSGKMNGPTPAPAPKGKK